MNSIRQAVPEDAVAVLTVVRQSITDSCVADHQNDPDTLGTWLANKTTQNFLSWISNPENFCVVACNDERVAGVGLLHRSGEIRLFFLAPAAQRHGLGKQIHVALEEKAKQWTLDTMHLHSTFLARGFYESIGYQPVDTPKIIFGVLKCYPYAKRLDSTISR